MGTDERYSAQATGINASGQITGWISENEQNTYSFITGPNAIGITALSSYGTNQRATGINSSGVVVGYSVISYQRYGAFRTFRNGVGLYILGRDFIRAKSVFAYGINDAGNITGRVENYVDSGPLAEHQFISTTNANKIVDLGTLRKRKDGRFIGWAEGYAVNNKGTVVGVSAKSNDARRSQATITNNKNKLINLNDWVVNLPDGVELSAAVGINASGQIAARGSDGHGYIVCPHENCAPE